MKLEYRFAIPRYLYELIWFAFNGFRPNSSMVRYFVPLFRGFNLVRLLWYGNIFGLIPSVVLSEFTSPLFYVGVYPDQIALKYHYFRLVSNVVLVVICLPIIPWVWHKSQTLCTASCYLYLLKNFMYMSKHSSVYQGMSYGH